MADAAFSSIIHVGIGGAKKLPAEIAPYLVDGWVDQGAGVPAAFRLTFRDPARLVLEKLGAKFGTKVVLTPIADGQGAGKPLLTGEITGLEADYDGTGTFTVIRGYDYGHRLMRQRRVVAYTNQTASDIARKLAGQDGVPIGRIETTPGLYEFISQSNVTDWDFLARLADENDRVMSLDAEGRFQFVKPKPSAGAPSPDGKASSSPFLLKAGRDILRLRAAVTASDQVSKVESRGWNVATKKKLVERQTISTDPGISIGETPGKVAGKFKAAKLVETHVPYDQQADVRFAAKALAADVTSSFAEVEVAARGNPKLRPGIPVALADVGKPFEGKYTVTSVRHTFGDGQHYESWVTVSGRQWRSLYGLASGGTSDGGGAKLPSVANAQVVDVKDPLEQGRVKLTFPWLDDAYVSDWARSVQLGGKGGGGVFPMDVGDEVLVGFDRGALDHPFVIGGLYNGRDKPTVVKDVDLHDKLRKQAIRHTLSDRKGNRVDLLSEQTGRRKQGVRIATGNNKLIVNLDRTKTEITVNSAGEVRIRGGSSVSVSAGADLTLSAARNMELRAGGMVTVQGGGMVSLRSAAALSVSAGAALSLTGAAATTLTGTGSVQINSVANVSVQAVTLMLKGGMTTIDTVAPLMVNRKPYPIP
jgi:phage protein D